MVDTIASKLLSLSLKKRIPFLDILVKRCPYNTFSSSDYRKRNTQGSTPSGMHSHLASKKMNLLISWVKLFLVDYLGGSKLFTVQNSSLLPAKCWPLLHVIAGISARFSNFAFVLVCCITNHLTTGPLGNSEYCFPRISMFPSTSSRETLRFSGNKIHCSPRDQSLSVKCFMVTQCSTPLSDARGRESS